MIFNINFLTNLVEMPKGFWEWIIGVMFGWMPNYAFRIVIFTLALKIVMLPLDFYQRKSMNDNAKKMKAMQPKIAKLQEQFGHDKNILNQKQMELYRKEKYNMFSSCLPMLISMVIFFSMFAGFMNISAYVSMSTYQNLHTEYKNYYNNTIIVDEYTPYGIDTLQEYLNALKEQNSQEILAKLSGTESEKQAILNQIFTATVNDLKPYENPPPTSDVFDKDICHMEMVIIARTLIAQDAVIELYETEEKQGFIGLIKSIWMSDVAWERPIPTQEKFESTLNRNALFGGKAGQGYLKEYEDIINEYDDVMAGLIKKYEKTPNGFFVFVILAAGLAFLTQFVAMKQNKGMTPVSGDKNTAMMGSSMMTTMLWMMPAMLGYFAATSPAAFTIYMVCNSLFGFLFSQLVSKFLKKYDAYREKKELETVHVLRRGIK